MTVGTLTSDATRVWAEIDLLAVRHNTRLLCGLLRRGAALMAVVKSEAYGHGAVPVARAALAAGATRLGINDVAEGIALRDAAIREPIQLLTSCLDAELQAGVEADLTFSVSSIDEIKALADRTRAWHQGPRRGGSTKVHLMADTGIGRGGFAPEEVWPAVERVKAEKTLEMEGIFTHFSSAEEPDKSPTTEQLAIFKQLLDYCKDRRVRFKVRHAANSAGTVFHPDAHYDLVRCGVLLHGMRGWPSERDGLAFQPTLSLHTRIVHLAKRPTGWTVGYNRTHACSHESLLATLPIGYSDGYRRELSSKALVIVRGMLCPVVGKVSMNVIVVDVTALEHSPQGIPAVGDEVTLIGGTREIRVSAEDLAEKANTISYDVTTQLSAKVARRYRGINELAESQHELRKIESVATPGKRAVRREPERRILTA
jgi:alanine racemase